MESLKNHSTNRSVNFLFYDQFVQLFVRFIFLGKILMFV